MKITTKKIIAKEFVILVSALVLTILAIILVFPFNYYQDFRIKNSKNKIVIKQQEAEKLMNEYRNGITSLYYLIQPSRTFDDKDDFINIASTDTLVYNKVSDIIFNQNSFKSIIYKALKENLLDFNKTENEFINACSDSGYVGRVFLTLQATFPDFDTSRDEFIKCMFADPSRFRDKLEYDNYIKKMRLKYIQSKELQHDAQMLNYTIEIRNNWRMTTKEQIHFGIKILLLLLCILYPIRYLYISTIWSVKTLRQKEME